MRRLVLLAMLIVPTIVPGQGHAAPNLAPNPGFEQSPTDPSGGVTRQPLLPTGWAFEGAAGLFDHSENDKHGGKRMAAISIPASTTREICQQEICADSPLNPVKDATAKYYSVTPYWRTLEPVPVQGGKSYSFSVWHRQSLATTNVGGATTKVRWVDANGLPLSETTGPEHIQRRSDPPETIWALMSRTVTSPSAARGAILMLGAADDAFITQVRYDDVSFSAV